MFQNFLKWLLGGGRIEEINLARKSSDVDFYLMPGQYINLNEETLFNWKDIARKYGMHHTVLQSFNKIVIQTRFWGKLIEHYTQFVNLEIGVSIYIPSAGEIVYNEFLSSHDDEIDAIQYFNNWLSREESIMLETAVKRASGTLGKHYGTESLIFLSPNHHLIGASEKRVEWVNNELQYKVNWGADLWKCNIYAHDVVFDAGFQPDVQSNQHYITAGELQLSDKFEELSVEMVQPGNLVQLYSGNQSNDSHNLILASFITKTYIEDNLETWRFIGLGAEADRAAASERVFDMKIELQENKYYVIDGKRELIRFFKPKWLRDEIV